MKPNDPRFTIGIKDVEGYKMISLTCEGSDHAFVMGPKTAFDVGMDILEAARVIAHAIGIDKDSRL